MATRPHDTQELQRTPARPTAPAGAGEAYDVERIRADFPILYRDVYGKPLVYLDNAASAQKPRSVIEAMDHVYRIEYANVHRGLHYPVERRDRQVRGRARDRAPLPQRRQRRRDHLHAQRHRRPSTSSPTRFGADIGEGDEIVLSIMEHHSNIVPWHFLRERHGAVLKWAPIADDGEFLLDEFERLLSRAPSRRHHAHVERARHGGADQGDHPARARARHPGAGRRQPGGGAPAGRRARPRLRLLRLHRPQDLRTDRHRRALRQEGAPRRHAALSGRRRHDRERARRPHHLRQAAAQVRGRHAADRARRSGSARRSTT